MVRFKICGLTRACEIDAINQLKPEYIGFVFAPSKRQVTISQAKDLISKTTYSQCVGVFVNEDLQKICEIAKETKLHVIQLHGEETQKDIDDIKTHTGCEVWKALRIAEVDDFQQLKQLHPDRFLLDSFQKDVYGGSGKCIDDALLKQIDTTSLILAGGIDATNIKRILAYHPYAIDVSSGVETDGVKDKEKIKRIIQEVRI